MTTTPPPASRARTPPTPLHGARHDSFHPYATRKSTRASLRVTTTPPPPLSSAAELGAYATTPPSTRRRMARRNSQDAFSPPPSKRSSPRDHGAHKGKGKHVHMDHTDDRDVAPPAVKGLENMRDHTTLPPSVQKNGHGSTRSTTMLPTPAKTPRKRSGQPDPALKHTARVLFQDRPENGDDVMPSPRKKVRKHSGLSLGSFADDHAAGDEDEIQIFTDSKERLPELDESADNPFYNKDGVSEDSTTGPKHASKKRKTAKDKSLDVDEMMKREDGMVYVFRGKKIFRKFDNSDDELGDDDSDDASPGDPHLETQDLVSSPHRSMTRSSIKPRLLFPSEHQRVTRSQKEAAPQPQLQVAPEVYDEEEAPTDIDELAQNSPDEAECLDDSDMVDAAGIPLPMSPITPVDELSADYQVSPPSKSSRSTGQMVAPPGPASEADELELPAPTKSKKVSPFDGWPRTKPGVGAHGRKRQGAEIERSGGANAKRTRSSAH